MISNKHAIRLLIGLSSLGIVFHILVLLKIIPHEVAWGGRLKSVQEMYVFESVSIALSLFLIWIYLLKAKNVKRKTVNIILWIFFVVFSLNTVGNLVAKTTFEKYFSILTLFSAILTLKILLSKNDN